MDKINTIEFDAMSGRVGAYSFVSEDLSRKGIDGNDPRIIGKRGDEFIMTTMSFFESLEQAALAIDEFESIVAKNAILNYAQKEYSVFIIWKQHDGPQKIISSDADHTHAVPCEWTMRRIK